MVCLHGTSAPDRQVRRHFDLFVLDSRRMDELLHKQGVGLLVSLRAFRDEVFHAL
jgi:hypothetical protein